VISGYGDYIDSGFWFDDISIECVGCGLEFKVSGGEENCNQKYSHAMYLRDTFRYQENFRFQNFSTENYPF
jgi:hypothetical protein